jgi:tetratricopeptide (TPR) repeat protein/predicted Ser/Thr protein kinase
MNLKCPECGGDVAAEPQAAPLTCPHCGTTINADSSGETLALTPEQIKSAGLTAAVPASSTTDYRHIIDGYELIRKLGEGAMGGVFLARQKSTGKQVALKILRGALARDRDYVDRLAREAKLAASLDHPNIIRAFETGESNRQHYLAMDYVDGENLHDVLERSREGRLLEKPALEIALQMARALAYAHTEGIVHRDIKPDNIMIARDGSARLADLGLAKQVDSDTALTQTGTTMGTPDYMSPEQARGDKDIDSRSDIYSLGATLFRLVTGRAPFEGSSPGVVIAKRLTETPPATRELNEKISAGCDRLINRMLSPHRDDRHQTPQELVIDIERVLSGEARAGKAASKPGRAKRPPSTRSGNVADRLQSARARYLCGDFAQAQQCYAGALEAMSGCREAWLGQVLMLLDMREYKDAWKWADKAVKMFKDDSELLAAKSMVIRKLGQEQYSQQLCAAALKLGAGAGLAWLSQGEQLLPGNLAKARKCFDKALVRASARELMHLRVAQAYLAQGEDQEALHMLRMALASLPQSALAHYLLGQAQEGLKKYDQAREAFARAAQLAPENQQYRAAAEAASPSITRRFSGAIKRIFKR